MPTTSASTLYNGIELPETFPPTDVKLGNVEPRPAPYLLDPPAVVPIDVGRQLFVDQFLVAHTNLIHRFHHPVKHEGNPVMWPTTPVEMGYGQTVPCATPKGGGVWYDNQRRIFRMWYEAGWLGMCCYAESEDGFHWTRPNLGEIPDGHGENQVLPNRYELDSWSVLLDPHTTDDRQRFKLFMRGPNGESIYEGGWAFTSPDGIHWENATQTGPCGDRSTAFYNPFRRKWVFSLRCKNKRARDYVEHDDFLTGAQWTEDQVLPWADADRYDEPGAGAPQLYNLDAVAYESVMLGLFEIFKGPENYICEQNREPKHTELMSAFSRDGFHWHRPDRTPFIPADRRRGAWEYGYVQSTSSVCLVVGDELWFYYIGFAGDRWTEMTKPRQNNLGMYANGATGLAKLRRDGFASFEAGVHSGKLTTRHVVFQGTELFVNVNTKGGQFRAEVLDGETGQPLPGLAFTDCDGFTGNSTRQRITWNGKNLASLAGKPVRFRFELTRGAIYAFWVSPDASGKSMGYLAGGGPGYDRIIDD